MASAPEKAHRIPAYIATALLWLASAGLGLAVVYYLHALSILTYTVLGGKEFWVGSLIGQVATLISGILWLALIIITGEYYIKHAAESKTWKILAYVLGVEIVIIAIGYLATRAV